MVETIPVPSRVGQGLRKGNGADDLHQGAMREVQES